MTHGKYVGKMNDQWEMYRLSSTDWCSVLNGLQWIAGWWFQPTPLKNMSQTAGIMKLPPEWTHNSQLNGTNYALLCIYNYKYIIIYIYIYNYIYI